MEPVGLAAGLAGLAGLYSVCLQGMDHIQAWMEMGKDSQRIYCMLQVEKYLLENWGESVGINVDGSMRTGNHHPALSIPRSRDVVYSILANIETIFCDGETLSNKYGINSAVGSSSHTTLQSTVTSHHETATKTKREISYFRKYCWVVKDKKKFELLVADLRGFIERLYAVITQHDGHAVLIADVAEKLEAMNLSLNGMSIA